MKAKGYVGTSMRDIASSMSIEAASLYNHIRNKEDILRENCFNLAARFIDSLNEILSSGDDSEVKLKNFIRNHIEILIEDLEASHVFLYEWKHLSEPHYGRFLSLRDEYERGLKKILKDDEENNSFENRLYRMVVINILASLNATEQWYNKDGEMDIDELCDHLTNILVKGIKEKI